jgi:hypothetical protein
MSRRTQTVVTVSYKSFNPANLLIADEPFALEKGGKLVNIKYIQDSRTYDKLRIQTPALTVGNVWDNTDDKTGQLASYTVALNLNHLFTDDAQAVLETPKPGADIGTLEKFAQRTFIEKLDAIDQATIDKAATNGWFKEKGKALDREKVEAKFTSTVHWPTDPKYSLGIRVKVTLRDIQDNKIAIVDQQNRDITFYKLDPLSNKMVFKYDVRYADIASEPMFNIESLRNRGTTVMRAIIESNNAWVQMGLSCSWKLVRVQVDVPDADEAGSSWIDEDDDGGGNGDMPTMKRRKTEEDGGSGGGGGGASEEMNSIINSASDEDDSPCADI